VIWTNFHGKNRAIFCKQNILISAMQKLNAILNNIGMDLRGCKIYTALFPCNECAKAIIQSGITEESSTCRINMQVPILPKHPTDARHGGLTCRKVNATIHSLHLSFDADDV
jgi:dCMP deaminase